MSEIWKQGTKIWPRGNLENLKEHATRLQNCIAKNGILKKYFVITKQKLESWKLIKQKKKIKKYDPPFLLKLEDLKDSPQNSPWQLAIA